VVDIPSYQCPPGEPFRGALRRSARPAANSLEGNLEIPVLAQHSPKFGAPTKTQASRKVECRIEAGMG